MGVLNQSPEAKSHWLLLLLWWSTIKGETFVLLLSGIQFLQILSVLPDLQREKLLRRPSGYSCTPGVEQLPIPRSTATTYAPRELLEAQLLQPEHSRQSATKATWGWKNISPWLRASLSLASGVITLISFEQVATRQKGKDRQNDMTSPILNDSAAGLNKEAT